MATAHERAQVLEPQLERERQRVAQLEAAVKDAERRAHDYYVQADIAAADAAHAEAAGLRRELAEAVAKLAGFEAAALAVRQQREREALEAQLERVGLALAEAVAAAQRQFAQVRPAMSAAKQELRAAMASEDRARQLQAEQHELQIHLGLRERGKFWPTVNAVRAALEAQPHLRELLLDAEL